MNDLVNRYLDQRMRWSKTNSAEFPYETTVGERRWRIRLNDFPIEPMYTLLIDEEVVGSFDDWPSFWHRN